MFIPARTKFETGYIGVILLVSQLVCQYIFIQACRVILFHLSYGIDRKHNICRLHEVEMHKYTLLLLGPCFTELCPLEHTSHVVTLCLSISNVTCLWSKLIDFLCDWMDICNFFTKDTVSFCFPYFDLAAISVKKWCGVLVISVTSFFSHGAKNNIFPVKTRQNNILYKYYSVQENSYNVFNNLVWFLFFLFNVG